MTSSVPNPPDEVLTDSLNSPLFDNGVRVEIPPERRKVDPSTIVWPDGLPKPWEEMRPPTDGTAR